MAGSCSARFISIPVTVTENAAVGLVGREVVLADLERRGVAVVHDSARGFAPVIFDRVVFAVYRDPERAGRSVRGGKSRLFASLFVLRFRLVYNDRRLSIFSLRAGLKV